MLLLKVCEPAEESPLTIRRRLKREEKEAKKKKKNDEGMVVEWRRCIVWGNMHITNYGFE